MDRQSRNIKKVDRQIEMDRQIEIDRQMKDRWIDSKYIHYRQKDRKIT